MIAAKNDSHNWGVILFAQAGKDIWTSKTPAIDDRDEYRFLDSPDG
jgi:hypothetical protein